MFSIEPVDPKQFRSVLKMLDSIEEGTVKELRTELKTKLQPYANQIASTVPSQPPLRGFANQGRTRWTGVKGKTSFTPGRSKRVGTNLVAIRIDAGESGGAGTIIAELAGSRSSGKTASGRAMINKLNELKPMKGKGGRFAYNQFRLLRPDILATAKRIVESTFAKFEGMVK